MPYTAPIFHDAGHSRPLRFELRLERPFQDAVRSIARAATASKRKDALENTEIALSVILGNLLRAHYRDPNRFVSVPRGNGKHRTGPFNPYGLGSRAVRKAIHHLLNADPAYVETMGGNKNPETKAGYYTRLRATKRLVDELEACLIVKDDTSDGLAMVVRPHSLFHDRLYSVVELPIIRLKPKKEKKRKNEEKNDGDPKDFLPLPDSPCVARMESNLARYNDFLRDHWVDLLIPDDEFLALQRRSKGDPDRYFGDPGRPIDLDLFVKRRLHRVFNNGTLDHGGRFYGGWWQNIPKRYRARITINWAPTVEIDYSSMHPNMLYAMEGKTAPKDCYALDGFPENDRDLLKTTFQKLLNAEGRIQPPLSDKLPEGWNWNDILDGLQSLHEPISKYFGKGKGIELQRLDSDIAEQVILRMMEHRTLALPVHDSFIVHFTRVDLLQQVMREVYIEQVGKETGFKVKTEWLERAIPAKAYELNAVGAYNIEDTIADLSKGPEYEKYRRRYKDFMSVIGEGWGHRHSFITP